MFLIFFYLFKVFNSLDNGLGKTPQMGWNSWNKFSCRITEKIIHDTIDAFVSTGLNKYG